MQRDVVLSCTALNKTYSQTLIPLRMLQEQVLQWYKKSDVWEKQVLKDVSFDVRRGEWIGIYGSNGAGKTTLLRILAGIQRPDSGSVAVTGKIACFFDLTAGFHPERTAAENIYISGLLHGLSAADIRRQTDKIIAYAGTESHRDLPLKCYSTGMMLRLAFASLLEVDADILLFDEIFAVGDEDFQRKCVQSMLELRQKGKTIILVAHSIRALRTFCDRIIYLDEGAIVKDELSDVAAVSSSNALFQDSSYIQSAPAASVSDRRAGHTTV